MEKLDDCISYIPASLEPLCADIFVIDGQESTWLYDVGNGEKALSELNMYLGKSTKSGGVKAVISHFHPDHMENLSKIDLTACFLGKNTFGYTGFGNIVEDDIYINDGVKLHIFQLPSSHAKGSVGLEVNQKYAFLGDAAYTTKKDGKYVYNTQLLNEQIKKLKSLKAQYFVLSHSKELVVEREACIKELEEIYVRRDRNSAYVVIQ